MPSHVVINIKAIGGHPRVLFGHTGWRRGRQMDVGRPVRHCCVSSANSLAEELGDDREVVILRDI